MTLLGLKPLLDVSDLRIEIRRGHSSTELVRGVGFQVQRGRCTALVGESGSGKSLTALALLGLLPKDLFRVQGSARCGDTELLNGHGAAALRGRRIAMVFQDPMTALHPFFTAGEQIAEVLRHHRPAPPRELAAKIQCLLADVGLDDHQRILMAYPQHLSGGQRQRVLLAMALAADPELLICDEPTTALDVTTQAQIITLLKSLQQTRGQALLFITHDLGVVHRLADEVLVMYAGRIVEQARSDEFFRGPRHPYARGLLDAVPRRSLTPGMRLSAIPGQPPDLWTKISGCAFAPRCAHRIATCAESDPPLLPAPPFGAIACPVVSPAAKGAT